jgi:hypothetical protein
MKPPRSLYAPPAIIRGQQCTGGATGLWSRAVGTMASALVPGRLRRRPLPEICQKLRYTHPHAAPRSHSWKRLPSCAVVWRRGVLHSVVNHRRIDGKDGVAGSIPAGGSTLNKQVRPGLVPDLLRDQRAGNRVCQRVCQSNLYVLSRGASPAEATPRRPWRQLLDPRVRPRPRSLDTACPGLRLDRSRSRRGGNSWLSQIRGRSQGIRATPPRVPVRVS